jgi:hypothetical protein
MVTKLMATFDGKAFIPEGNVRLKPNARYELTVRSDDTADIPPDVPYPLMEIHKLATDMGLTDLAERHKHYAHPGPEGD